MMLSVEMVLVMSRGALDGGGVCSGVAACDGVGVSGLIGGVIELGGWALERAGGAVVVLVVCESLPLFNTAAWKIAKNILELIKNGYVSDPPGIQLYYCLGFDKKAGGLPIYRCVRGTNIVEGGVHTHLIARLPSRGASVCHMIACLLDFILGHNLRVGHFNSTGHKYTGHDSIWLLNEIQELEITLGEHYNIPPAALAWVNGNLYVQTEQTAGIIQIPKSVRESVKIQPYNQETDSKQKQAYLAKMQGTRKPVLPVLTAAEKQLFANLMRTSQTFQKCNTSISLPAAEIWNQKAETTADIYYKLEEQLTAYLTGPYKDSANIRQSCAEARGQTEPLLLEYVHFNLTQLIFDSLTRARTNCN
ncbi:hypothetical protein C8R46DRAFT_1237847 [Mycena filopes]|nr:hypothetical protein C8R46DRAFT_1237847 [Mycena filopes]